MDTKVLFIHGTTMLCGSAIPSQLPTFLIPCVLPSLMKDGIADARTTVELPTLLYYGTIEEFRQHSSHQLANLEKSFDKNKAYASFPSLAGRPSGLIPIGGIPELAVESVKKLILYAMEVIDFDGGMRGQTWSSKLFLTKEKAMEAANDYMNRKGWDDQVWRPYAEWIDPRCSLPAEWDRWSNNRNSMVVTVHQVEVLG